MTELTRRDIQRFHAIALGAALTPARIPTVPGFGWRLVRALTMYAALVAALALIARWFWPPL